MERIIRFLPLYGVGTLSFAAVTHTLHWRGPVARGQSDREIARDLQLSAHTVRHHLTAAMQTTGATSRAQLVALCYAAGVLEVGVWPPVAANARCLRLTRGAGI
ncbi:MAG: helix-turn-helix transcriptional regulator [Nocardioides sp.]|nr:helix-turn-helix transcriptional regulator [Nocardioides sp.]